jgi:hypothetical protein
MQAADLLADLRARGFTLSREGGGIRVSPRCRLSPEIRSAIRAHKAELLALLAPPAGTGPQTRSGSRRGSCRRPAGTPFQKHAIPAARLLGWCKVFGVALAAGADGSLNWEADEDPPDELLAALATATPEVLALLENADLARRLERVLRAPAGSMRVWDARLPQCPGCYFCQWRE